MWCDDRGNPVVPRQCFTQKSAPRSHLGPLRRNPSGSPVSGMAGAAFVTEFMVEKEYAPDQ
jgi:hypothetical protein